MFYTRGLRKRLKPRFLHLYLRFFWMVLRSRLIHAAIDRSVFNFFWAIPLFFFFFFPQTHFEPSWSLKSPITLHLSDLKPSPLPSISDQKPSPHPPSLISTVTLHLFDLNPRLTLHLRSPPSPSISPISSRHPYPPSTISTLTLTLHLRSQPSLSPFISLCEIKKSWDRLKSDSARYDSWPQLSFSFS